MNKGVSGSLKSPYPYFGGKSTVAPYVWERFGDVDNLIDPFFGSGAFPLSRPSHHKGKYETVNDLNEYIPNFWRAVQAAPEKVAEYADWIVSESDLHARHAWLMGLGSHALNKEEFVERVRNDPDYYNAKVAGWWVWGASCWIGAGWCDEKSIRKTDSRPKACGINPHNRGTRTLAKRPQAKPKSVNAGTIQARPGLHSPNGIHSIRTGRVQLADLYDIGRGVNGHGEFGTCAERRQFIVDWLTTLSDRIRLMRICSGDWKRVCSSPSVTYRLGTTGVFFDPPYGEAAGRDNSLYAKESGTVALEVREYCLEWGQHPDMRIALCGYAGEGHEILEDHGWDVWHWKAQGGYGNRNKEGNQNKKKERIWFSPHCLKAGLFD